MPLRKAERERLDQRIVDCLTRFGTKDIKTLALLLGVPYIAVYHRIKALQKVRVIGGGRGGWYVR